MSRWVRLCARFCNHFAVLSPAVWIKEQGRCWCAVYSWSALRSSRGPFSQITVLTVTLAGARDRRSAGSPEHGCWPVLTPSLAVLVSHVCYKLPTFRGITQQDWILLQFWRRRVWAEYYGAKIKVISRAGSCWKLQWRIHSYFFQLLVAASIPWLVTTLISAPHCHLAFSSVIESSSACLS